MGLEVDVKNVGVVATTSVLEMDVLALPSDDVEVDK